MFKERSIITEIEHKLLHTSNVIVITGARQVGKTSIMQYLLEKYRIHFTQNVLFVDLEDELLLTELKHLPNSRYPAWLANNGLTLGTAGLLCIDEIQYLAYPTKVLKYLHDHYPSIKIIVSGSSSLHIQKKIQESLTGRKSVFTVFPLSWYEFLKFKDSKLVNRVSQMALPQVLQGHVRARDLIGLDRELEPLWEEFVTFGGYPKVTLTPGIADKSDELKEIYNSYVKKDVKDLAGIKEVGKFSKLVQLLGWQVGNLAVASELSNSSDLTVVTVNAYLELLEGTFVIQLLKPFYRNKRVEIVKTPKVYFLDNGLRNAVAGNFSPPDSRPDRGQLVENAVLHELVKGYGSERVRYWRKKNTGLEVDFVVEGMGGEPLLPLEVKYASFTEPRVPRSLHSFIEIYHPRYAVVLNKNLLAQVPMGSTTVVFAPIWVSVV